MSRIRIVGLASALIIICLGSSSKADDFIPKAADVYKGEMPIEDRLADYGHVKADCICTVKAAVPGQISDVILAVFWKAPAPEEVKFHRTRVSVMNVDHRPATKECFDACSMRKWSEAEGCYRVDFPGLYGGNFPSLYKLPYNLSSYATLLKSRDVMECPD